MNERKPDRVGQVFAALGKSVCYLVLFMGMQIVVMLPVMFSAVIEAALGGDEDAVYAILNADAMVYSAISGVLTIAVVLAFYLIRRKKLSEALMLRKVSAPTLLTGVVLAPGLYVIISIALGMLPESWLESYAEASEGIDSGTLAGVIVVVLVAPIVEEFIFRGLMMNRLSRVMPGWLAVVLSAAVFGACHGHPVWFAYAFVLGAFFGFIDLRAGSLWPSILGHMAFNSFSQIYSFLPETDEASAMFMGVLMLLGIALPIINHKAIAALFRPAPAVPAAAPEQVEKPGRYDYDPWDL